MKYCRGCGKEMTEDAAFCQNCGQSVHADETVVTEPQIPKKKQKGYIGCYIAAGVFALLACVEPTMLAIAILFAFLGFMFWGLARNVGEPSRVSFKKGYKGMSKGLFIFLCVFCGVMFFLIGIVAWSDDGTVDNIDDKEAISTVGTDEEGTNAAESVVGTDEEGTNVAESVVEPEQPKEKSDVPDEFASECPISVSASLYDTALGLPNLSCSMTNLTDKEILAVKVYFVPRDIYGEEIHYMLTSNKIKFDSPIGAYETDSQFTSLLDDDIKSGEVYVYSVYFEDGTEWGNREASVKNIKKYGVKLPVTY